MIFDTFQDLDQILQKAEAHPSDSSDNNIFFLLEGVIMTAWLFSEISLKVHVIFLRRQRDQQHLHENRSECFKLAGDVERHLVRLALKIVYGSDSKNALQLCMSLSLVIP